MADKLYAVNAALAHLGEEVAVTLEEATMREATRKVLAHLEQARDAVLARDDWYCAIEYVTLSASTLPANWKYAYTFELPGDAVRLSAVVGVSEAWEKGTRTDENGASRTLIRTNAAGPINAAYVRRAAWEALDPTLLDAIALDLAARACHSINGSVERASALRRLADEAIGLAMGVDATQSGGQDGLVEDTFYNLRQSAV